MLSSLNYLFLTKPKFYKDNLSLNALKDEQSGLSSS